MMEGGADFCRHSVILRRNDEGPALKALQCSVETFPLINIDPVMNGNGSLGLPLFHGFCSSQVSGFCPCRFRDRSFVVPPQDDNGARIKSN